MTKLVLQMGISIDGFVARADGSQPWLGEREDDAAKQWKLDTVRGADAHVIGRITYEAMATAWPHSDSEYAAPMNDIPKIVFSKTIQRAEWPESRIASGDLVEEIEGIKAQPGGYVIAYGGAEFGGDWGVGRAGGRAPSSDWSFVGAIAPPMFHSLGSRGRSGPPSFVAAVRRARGVACIHRSPPDPHPRRPPFAAGAPPRAERAQAAGEQSVGQRRPSDTPRVACAAVGCDARREPSRVIELRGGAQ